MLVRLGTTCERREKWEVRAEEEKWNIEPKKVGKRERERRLGGIKSSRREK